jgi:hypothetical protein
VEICEDRPKVRKMPNHSTDPTPTSVTRRAEHAARRP